MSFDFIVIGGGIAGTSAGARLSDLGRVLLLEAEPALAYHASGRSAALYEANYGSAVTIALNVASRSDHETLDGGVLSPRGLMLLAGPGEEEVFANDLATMGLPRITAEEAADRIPVLDPARITGAGLHEDAWDIDTDRLVQHFARLIRDSGGEVRTGAAVTGIDRGPDGWRVAVGAEVYTARQLVNAAGAWADKIAAMAGVAPIGLTPLRRSVARVPAPMGLDVSGWPMMLGAGENWYAKPDAGALIISPAEEDPVAEPHDAWPEDLALAEGIARYQVFAKEEVTRVTSSWAGLRTFSPDRALVLGPDPDMQDFIWCAGQGGYGFQTSPAASRLVADLVGGRVPDLDADTVAALTPSRFQR